MKTCFYGRRKFFIAPLILVAIAAVSAIFMLLWNALMPVIFALPVINFWQAAGLLILSKLLFGSHHPHGAGQAGHMRANLREKLSKMSPEERKEFLSKMHYGHHHWPYDRFCNKEQTVQSKAE
jgi:hypothetical protein